MTSTTHHAPRNRGRSDRGSASVELAILLPVTLALLALIIVGFRLANASNRMAGTASTAAREASLARTPGEAQQRASSSATSALRAAGFNCIDTRVTVDTSGFTAVPGGPIGTVTVDVYCTVQLSDLGMPFVPGDKTLHDRASSPVDPTRGSS